MRVISVSKDFSPTPGGRLKVMGPDSGEQFRGRILSELKKSPPDTVKIIFDGAFGYGSSFLEEAFGGLIRSTKVSLSEARLRLILEANSKKNQTYVKEAWQYMEDAGTKINVR